MPFIQTTSLKLFKFNVKLPHVYDPLVIMSLALIMTLIILVLISVYQMQLLHLSPLYILFPRDDIQPPVKYEIK